MMTYEQDIDDEWYPQQFLESSETLLVLDKFPGAVNDMIFRPPWTMTTVYVVLSSKHGITHVCEESMIHCCEMIADASMKIICDLTNR